MIFDTHAHFCDEAYDEDRQAAVEDTKAAGVEKICEVGASMDSSKAAINLAGQYPGIYAAVGVHPDSVGTLEMKDMDRLKEMAKAPKVVAIGEIGLDYHYLEEEKEVQELWMRNQIEVAKEIKKPIIVHSREAAEDTMRIIREMDAGKTGGVIHCFSYSVEQAMAYIEMGFKIGLGGVTTFKNAKKAKAVAKEIPLTALVLETDCPYMAPEPNRGKRNTSAYLPYVAREIAALRGISEEEVCEQTYWNAMELYHLQ